MPLKGYKQTKEHIEKARLPKLGKSFYSWKGKKRTEEDKNKHRGDFNVMRRSEVRAKLSMINKGRKITDEHKIKIGLANKGKVRSEETKQKLRIAMMGKNAIGIANDRIEQEIPELEKQGFRCIPIGRVIPDIIAIKDNKVYAIEVEYGRPNYAKYTDVIKNYYDDIIWILRKKN